MTIYKRARLTPVQRREIFDKYFNKGISICETKLFLLKRETPFSKPEYLFVAIDDFSRELYAAILPDKTQYSAELQTTRLIPTFNLIKFNLIKL